MNDVTTAEKVLSYGDRAVAQGKRVADVPAKKGAPKAPPSAPVEPHVEAARKVWQQHFAKTYAQPPVVILDLGKAPSVSIQKSTFGAWTNSATRIYLNSKANSSSASLLTTIHHEAEHIRQFRKDGKPPKDYTAMMEYEEEAYGASSKFTRDHPDPAVQALNSFFHGLWGKVGDAMDQHEKDYPDPVVRNVQYGKWLVANKMLPPHKLIGDLYR